MSLCRIRLSSIGYGNILWKMNQQPNVLTRSEEAIVDLETTSLRDDDERKPPRKKSSSLLKTILNYYQYLLDTYPPWIVKSVTAALISFLANVVSSRFIKKEPAIDWKTVLNFSITGGISAICSHHWYGILDNIMIQLKKVRSLRPVVCNPVLEKFAIVPTLIDQVAYAPFINTVFIGVLALLESRSFSVDPVLVAVKRDFWTTLYRGYMLWPLATIVVLSSCPPDLRVLFFNLVGFFWNCYLSYAL